MDPTDPFISGTEDPRYCEIPGSVPGFISQLVLAAAGSLVLGVAARIRSFSRRSVWSKTKKRA